MPAIPQIRPVSDLRNNLSFEYEVYQKLREAEIEAESSDVRLSSEEVFSSLRTIIK
jgi:hypothetical protein